MCVCAKTIHRERGRNRQRKKESKQGRKRQRERERVLPTTRYTVYSTRNNEVETGQFYPFAPQNYTVLPDITSVFNNPRLCWVPVGSMWIFRPATPSASKQRPSGFSTSAAEVKSWQKIQIWEWHMRPCAGARGVVQLGRTKPSDITVSWLSGIESEFLELNQGQWLAGRGITRRRFQTLRACKSERLGQNILPFPTAVLRGILNNC